tara:strand:- start:94 stop:393 length:300 start_codon:yes stop_codon:yes gene_type:complete
MNQISIYPRYGATFRPSGIPNIPEDLKDKFYGRPYNKKKLEYLAMTPEQKTWFLLTNTAPDIPPHYGPRFVQVKSGQMYEMLVRKWANQKLAEMDRLKA